MKKKGLLIVDPQVDFITGSLRVSGAVEAMNTLATYIKERGDDYAHIIVTADSHPLGHCSFEETGGEWPRHCVADTVGAAIWPPLMDAICEFQGPVTILHKGEHPDTEEYSIFKNPEAAGKILYIMADEELAVTDVCGIAGDVCVAATLNDGIRLAGRERFSVLTRFTPSLDGGAALESLISNYGISCDR